MESMPWFAWIAIVGIPCGITYSLVVTAIKEKTKRAELAVGDARLTERVNALESRLAQLESARTTP
ncbi:hypothetical protein [Leifsonia sp. Root4]|uniref:hypothetical protein n=1 Tax=Leifsonia sp. Root4 TaxID=1736525 RepID=UPI000A692B5A|nr:hypothetical protein [Leifsonia sp. Root4]